MDCLRLFCCYDPAAEQERKKLFDVTNAVPSINSDPLPLTISQTEESNSLSFEEKQRRVNKVFEQLLSKKLSGTAVQAFPPHPDDLQ